MDVVGALLSPEGEPVGGSVFSDEDCKICCSRKEERDYTTKRCCNFSLFIVLFISRKAFMRRSPKERDRVLRKNSGVEDAVMENERVRRRNVNYGRESSK